VTDDVNMQAGTELYATLQRAKQQVMVSRLWNESSQEQIEQVRRKSNENDVIIVAVYLSIGSWKGKLGVAESLAKFVGEIAQSSKPSVLVAFGDPYILGKIPSMDVVLACYNGTILAERSIGNALLGLSPMKGKLPVTIPGKYTRGAGLEFSTISQKKGE
jgi:beta-N-acetylhexosaminidase